MFASRSLLIASLAAPLLLGACTQTGTAPTSPATPAAIVGSTAGAGCAAEIARFEDVLSKDVESGNLARRVYDRAGPDLRRASAACQAGRDGEARSLLASTKSRLGYS